MNNPLQNKAVVITLAAIAVTCVAGSFVDWPRRNAVVATPREATAIPVAPAETFEVPHRPAIFERLAGTLGPPVFAERDGRPDPFAWPRGQVSIPTNSESAMHFVVSAISVEADKALAVINRRVVSCGDRLGEFAVDQILPTQVWLQGPHGRISLTLAR